ncbi:MAG: hypothetical protein D6713_00325 [Deltaproteobacteria bacterium]|nr:MAG: hypothetical protein D6713_00325 [Deltaproteobacteria bacterium]
MSKTTNFTREFHTYLRYQLPGDISLAGFTRACFARDHARRNAIQDYRAFLEALSLPHFSDLPPGYPGFKSFYRAFVHSLTPAKISWGNADALTCDTTLFLDGPKHGTLDYALMLAFLYRFTDEEFKELKETVYQSKRDCFSGWMRECIVEKIVPVIKKIQNFRKTKFFDAITKNLSEPKELFTVSHALAPVHMVRDFSRDWAVVFTFDGYAGLEEINNCFAYIPWPIGFVKKGDDIHRSLACLLFSNPYSWPIEWSIIDDARGIPLPQVAYLCHFTGELGRRAPEMWDDPLHNAVLLSYMSEGTVRRIQKKYDSLSLREYFFEVEKTACYDRYGAKLAVELARRFFATPPPSEKKEEETGMEGLEKAMLENERRQYAQSWLSSGFLRKLCDNLWGKAGEMVLVQDLDSTHFADINWWLWNYLGAENVEVKMYSGHSFVTGMAYLMLRKKVQNVYPEVRRGKVTDSSIYGGAGLKELKCAEVVVTKPDGTEVREILGGVRLKDLIDSLREEFGRKE